MILMEMDLRTLKSVLLEGILWVMIQVVGPKKISKPNRKNYISFTRYKDDFNSGDDRIEYIVETSSDLRTWNSSGVTLDKNLILAVVWKE